ncbi:hypothetical protein ACFL6Y_03100 [Elusimicrobiota bacterium]
MDSLVQSLIDICVYQETRTLLENLEDDSRKDEAFEELEKSALQRLEADEKKPDTKDVPVILLAYAHHGCIHSKKKDIERLSKKCIESVRTWIKKKKWLESSRNEEDRKGAIKVMKIIEARILAKDGDTPAKPREPARSNKVIAHKPQKPPVETQIDPEPQEPLAQTQPDPEPQDPALSTEMDTNKQQEPPVETQIAPEPRESVNNDEVNASNQQELPVETKSDPEPQPENQTPKHVTPSDNP